MIETHDMKEPAPHERRIRSFVLRQGRTTPAQPSSIAIAASEAVPTPASTSTGTSTRSMTS